MEFKDVLFTDPVTYSISDKKIIIVSIRLYIVKLGEHNFT